MFKIVLYSVWAFMLYSCKEIKMQPIPADAEMLTLLKDYYRFQNNYDGAEYVTIDTLYLMETDQLQDSIFQVRYHIACSYTAPAMPPGYVQAQRDALITDAVALITKRENKWILKYIKNVSE